MDQIEALNWVNRYIAYFGGDPKRITIGGHSAGSMSVSSLTLSPKSQSKFFFFTTFGQQFTFRIGLVRVAGDVYGVTAQKSESVRAPFSYDAPVRRL